ncbi:MAG: hypothetical protein JKY65_19915 [Planctomycetes bacterium]|nr:hypothetical protein [Planctomycetota bacterium]
MNERLQKLGTWLENSWLVRYAWDNPSAEQDARSILSAPKVGLWLGLEVLAILIATGSMLVIAPAEEREFRDLLETVGTGGVLIDTTFLTITALLALIVPFRASGLLEGPRWRGYLDQVITTGLSPLRYFAGKFAASQPFFLAILLASFPFVTLFGLLGGADWGRVFFGYLLLYLYANLLLAVACALGSLMHEILAVLLTLILAVLGNMAAWLPFPAVFATYSPARYFLLPSVETISGSEAALLKELYGVVQLFGFSLPWLGWTLAVWALLLVLCLLTCALGPLHAFVPGLNNFGTLVLPGDAKRFRLRKFRPFVARRTELAFLFDNRPVILNRWVLPLRAVQILALLSLFSVQLFASNFTHPFMKDIDHEVVVGGEVALISILAVLSVTLLTAGRAQALTQFRLAGLAIPQVVFDVAVMVFFLAGLSALHVLGWGYAWEDLSQPRSFWRSMGDPRDLFRLGSLALATLIPLTLSTFLLMKLLSARFLGKGWVFLAAFIFLMFFMIFPLILIPVSEALATSKILGARDWAEPIYFMSLASPTSQGMALLESPPRWIEGQHWLFERGFWFWQGLLILYLGGLCVRAHWAVLQTASIFSSDSPESEARGKHPCPRCRSPLQIPTPYTAWGGILFTYLLKSVRCLECGADFDGPTGKQRPQRAFYVGLVRYAILGGALVFGTYLLIGSL